MCMYESVSRMGGRETVSESGGSVCFFICALQGGAECARRRALVEHLDSFLLVFLSLFAIHFALRFSKHMQNLLIFRLPVGILKKEVTVNRQIRSVGKPNSP